MARTPAEQAELDSLLAQQAQQQSAQAGQAHLASAGDAVSANSPGISLDTDLSGGPTLPTPPKTQDIPTQPFSLNRPSPVTGSTMGHLPTYPR